MKPAEAFAYLFVWVLMLWLGPLAWNYVAPLFKLPELTFWQWFVTAFALRCLRGPNADHLKTYRIE
jgi:hypothetical protein